MGICCKLAAVKYDIEHRYPLIMKIERRMCVVEKELNKNNPCCNKRRGGKCISGHKDDCYRHKSPLL